MNDTLELRVTQRTAELEALNQELANFAYIVSHDLKTPLRGISQLAHWISQDYAAALDAQGSAFLQLLMTRVKRLDAMINGILEYSRIGRITHPAQNIDFNILLPHLIETLHPPTHIQVTLTTAFPTLLLDVTRISQVFKHLLGNAIKFMGDTPGEIRLGCLETPTAWQFSVGDTGPGLDPKYHEKIFQMFQTLSNRDESEDMGIGLALVKKIIECCQGQVWVESTPGVGSTFLFTLPKSRGGLA